MYCNRCGNKLSNSDVFCNQCGSPRKTDGAPAQSEAESKTKRKTPLIAVICVAAVCVAGVSVLVVTLGGDRIMDTVSAYAPRDSAATSSSPDEGSTSAPPEPATTAPATVPSSAASPDDAVSLSADSSAGEEPGEAEATSAAWKKAVLGMVREHYENGVRKGYADGTSWPMSVKLEKMDDDSVVAVRYSEYGFIYETTMASGYYRFIDNSLETTLTSRYEFKILQNKTTGKKDALYSLEAQGGTQIHIYENGKWRTWAEVGMGPGAFGGFTEEWEPSSMLAILLYDETGERVAVYGEGREEYDPTKFEAAVDLLNEFYYDYEIVPEPPESDYFQIGHDDDDGGTHIPWQDIAIRISDYMDSYDGIATDIAEREGLRFTPKPDAPDWANTYAEFLNATIRVNADGRNLRLDAPQPHERTNNYTLADISFDGIPELMSYSYACFAHTLSDAEDITNNPKRIYDEGTRIGGMPTHYYKNPDTGNVLFVTEETWSSTGYRYFDAETMQEQFEIYCDNDAWLDDVGNLNYGHSHQFERATDEKNEKVHSPVSQEECRLEGGNGADPMLDAWLDEILGGYTEIPAPVRYDYDDNDAYYDETGRYLVDPAVIIKEVQDWIYSVASEYNE